MMILDDPVINICLVVENRAVPPFPKFIKPYPIFKLYS